jgi:hypothetical protein
MKDKNILMYILAALIIIGFFVLLYIVAYSELPQNNKDILNLMAGALIGSFTSIVNYFFGSSKGSADKNELLNKKQ